MKKLESAVSETPNPKPTLFDRQEEALLECHHLDNEKMKIDNSLIHNKYTNDERDELKCLAYKTIEERPLKQVAAMAQVCLDLHDALGVRWGDDPYTRIRELQSLLPRPDVLPPLPPNDQAQI